MISFRMSHLLIIVMVITSFVTSKQAINAFPPGQPAFWPKYSRTVQLLDSDSAWSFGLNLDEHFDSLDPHFDPSKAHTPNKTKVPSCIDAVPPGYMGPRGVGMYRRSFTLKAGLRGRLQFGACSFFCRVFVDGKEIGEHRNGGYSMFHLDVPVSKDSTRELLVLADNRFNKTTAPLHTGGDFWHYGGIMRSVVLHEIPTDSPVIWRTEIIQIDAAQGVVNIRIVLSDSKYSGDFEVWLSFDDGKSELQHLTAKNGIILMKNQTVPNPKIWSIRKAKFHTLTVLDANKLGITERFGLRTFGVDLNTSRLTVNGKIVKLHGWNHHTQWPKTGAAPTDDQLDSDIVILKRGGTTYVRGAHYPQDPRWLDRLDEAGIIMWEETLGPGVSVKDTKNKNFMHYQLQQIDEMLNASYNHPSIMTWGFFNEGPSNDDSACPAYAACADRLRSRDPTRFVTWASNKQTSDKCLAHASLISFNNYPAWYNNFGDLTAPRKHWNSMASYVREKYPGKPFAISETGAGGVWEWSHNKTDAKWTIKYQVEVISADVEVALENNNISGITLWHFFDFKGNDEATKSCGPCQYEPDVSPPTCAYIDVSCHRPGGENHKGVIGFWRREKESFSIVAKMYNKTN